MEPKQKIFVTIGTVAIVATAAIGGLALFKSPETSSAQATTSTSSQTASSTPTTSSTTTTTTTPSTPTTADSASTYKDGTYTTTANYNVPHGATNSVTVTLVVSGDKISSVKTTNNYSDGESSYYISSFESSVSSDATGQSLSNYSPSRIGGASLTTYAFSNALDNIRTQAAA